MTKLPWHRDLPSAALCKMGNDCTQFFGIRQLTSVNILMRYNRDTGGGCNKESYCFHLLEKLSSYLYEKKIMFEHVLSSKKEKNLGFSLNKITL